MTFASTHFKAQTTCYVSEVAKLYKEVKNYLRNDEQIAKDINFFKHTCNFNNIV
jgi:hypothetical protein